MTELKRMSSSRYGISRVLMTNWVESNVTETAQEHSGERIPNTIWSSFIKMDLSFKQKVASKRE